MTFGRLGSLGSFNRLGGGGAASGFMPGAVTDLRFDRNAYLANNRRYSAFTDIPGLTASGGVNGTVARNGLLASASAPRIGDDGLVVEGAATNLNPNSTYQGGGAGTYPTGMETFAGGGLSETLIGVGVEAGYDYFERRVYGTIASASGSALFIALTGDGAIPVTGGETYTLSGHAELVGGSFDNTVNYQMDIRWFDAAGANISRVAVIAPLDETHTISDSLQSGTVVAPANAAYARPSYELSYNSVGQPVDVTLRYYPVQLELGSTASSYVPTSGSAATRTADSVTLATSDLGWADDQTVNLVYEDGTTGTHDALAGTFTFPVSVKKYARAYA